MKDHAVIRQSPPLPNYIQQYAFDFRWSNELLWQVHGVPVERMTVDDLLWHFTVPWLRSQSGERFAATPHEIMTHPEKHVTEYERTMMADTSYPIDIMYHKGRWLILDGLHRLMKLVDGGATTVDVRKIPRDKIPLFAIA